jgi:hypothetical protein
MASSKKEFRNGLYVALVPVLTDHGFKEWRPGGRDEAPILHFERHLDKRRDLLDIQFDKYGRWQCLVNLASISGESVETMYEGRVPAESATIAHLRERTRLKGKSLSGAFRPSLFSRWMGTPADAGAAVGRRIAEHWSEAEKWFQTQQLNKHLECYKL